MGAGGCPVAGWCWLFWPRLIPPLPSRPCSHSFRSPPPTFLPNHYISDLPCAGEDRRDMAGRCLGELVRKMGDRILAQIIPILRQGMASPEATTRQVSTPQHSMRFATSSMSRNVAAAGVAPAQPGLQAMCARETTRALVHSPVLRCTLASLTSPSLPRPSAAPSLPPAGCVQRPQGSDGECEPHTAGRPPGGPAAAHPGALWLCSTALCCALPALSWRCCTVLFCARAV